MSSAEDAPSFALPTPKFMPVRPDHSVWNLLEGSPALPPPPRAVSFPFPPVPPEPVSAATLPQAALPVGPLPDERASLDEGLPADHGGVAGPASNEGERGDRGEGVGALEHELLSDGDRLGEIVEGSLDLDVGSENSKEHEAEAAWYADARDVSKASASTSFELVSDSGPRSELAGDSAWQARESLDPLPVWLASREADMDLRARAMVSIAKRRRLEIPRLP